jgi:cellulose biosynthesis protein BcsQ
LQFLKNQYDEGSLLFNLIGMNLIAFVSQSGNVMKSTLATAMALEAVHNGLSVKVADLDNEHRTVEEWIEQRRQFGIEPVFDYFAPNSADEALNGFNEENLCIIDAPSRATEATLKIAEKADLVVQPVTA